MGGTVFMALGSGRERGREASATGERKNRGYEPFVLHVPRH